MHQIGYKISGTDNGGYFFSDAPPQTFCERCQTVVDHRYVPRRIDIHRSKRYDFSVTYDLRWLFSPRLFQIFRSAGLLKGEAIHRVCDEPEYYYFNPSAVVPFDRVSSKSEVGELCPVCKWPEFLVGGATRPVLLLSELPPGIYRTDDFLGDRGQRGPLFVVDLETGEQLKKARLRGAYFHPCFGLEAGDPRVVNAGLFNAPGMKDTIG